MSLNILADENIPAVEHYLGALGKVQRVQGRTLQRAQLQDVDVLLVRSVTRVDEALLAGTPVRFLGTATSGFDHVDRDYLARRGIAFAHAPGSNANSVVEYVLAAIAAVGDTLEQLLAGGVVGIVGYGMIGQAVAARLNALNIAYRIYDPWLDQHAIPHAADLNQILSCDVVSLHAELTRQQPWPSFHLLGAAQLHSLPSHCLLINTCRGPVVDNAALLAQLESGRGMRAVLDVWEGEPDIDRALLERTTLGTAHIAGYSLDGKVLATRQLRDALAAHLQCGPMPEDGPIGSAAGIAVADTLSDAQLIRCLLQSRYDIRLDDALLRQTLLRDSPVAVRGNGFDELRKTYRDRRELAGSTVHGSELSPAQLALVRALGCVTVLEGKVP